MNNDTVCKVNESSISKCKFIICLISYILYRKYSILVEQIQRPNLSCVIFLINKKERANRSSYDSCFYVTKDKKHAKYISSLLPQ